MIFTETGLCGAYLIGLEPIYDERGFFARSWCSKEFEKHGLNPTIVQCNISVNKHKGTLRGMHYQITPAEEAKFIRCIRGVIYDVIVDIRPSSPTYLQWFGIELNDKQITMLYAPVGIAHGFITLCDDAEVFYQMSNYYEPECAKGLRWNDPAFDIEWPLEPVFISEKDRSYGNFQI